MAKFDSPLGDKNFSGPQMREFTVPDATFDQGSNPGMAQFHGRTFEATSPDIESEFKAAREAKRQGDRLNEGAKKRIEILLGMTRTTRDVPVGEHTFTLQTLKSKELREAIVAASQYDGTVQSSFEIRRQYLARSLTQVAGVDIDSFLGSTDLQSKLLFIDELDEPLINHLYSEYLELIKTAREKFSVNNENDAKEIAEDLKK